MGWNDPDVYCQPEHFGLKILSTLDIGGSYEFDMTVVWQDTETREFFFASDAGCSCPSPFEQYTSRDKLHPLNDDTWDEFVQDVNGMSYGYQNDKDGVKWQKADFIVGAQNLLRKG